MEPTGAGIAKLPLSVGYIGVRRSDGFARKGCVDKIEAILELLIASTDHGPKALGMRPGFSRLQT